MRLEDGAIEEFQKLFLQQYGQKLTNEDTLELGTRLINLVKAVYGTNLPKLKMLDTGTKKEDN